MVDISAKIICDSIGEYSPRLTTFLVRYPKFIHSEHLRHRSGSYCVSSSRAIPVSKNLEEVRSDELRAGPVFWGREQKGMQAGSELSSDRTLKSTNAYFYRTGKTEKEGAQVIWATAAYHASRYAELLQQTGAHKSIVNRLLEPFLHVNVLVTSCEQGLLNFFGLRLDKAAQAEIRKLAEEMWRVWNESKPKPLNPGEYHLPFIDDETLIEVNDIYTKGIWLSSLSQQDALIRISIARCARLSYMSFETGKRSNPQEDLKLYDRLLGAQPIHASPAEHIATPDKIFDGRWVAPHLHGNLPGWVQFRKLLPNESQAPLPEGYKSIATIPSSQSPSSPSLLR